MSNLLLESYKHSHKVMVGMEHDSIILINTLHISLYLYYLVYEWLNSLLTHFSYPKLPTFSGLAARLYGSDSEVVRVMTKVLLLIGAIEGLLGSANCKLRHIFISTIICGPFVIYDLYLFSRNSFHSIRVSHFLLFQTLLTSTIRTIRLAAAVSNIALTVQILITNERAPLSFSDFL